MATIEEILQAAANADAAGDANAARLLVAEAEKMMAPQGSYVVGRDGPQPPPRPDAPGPVATPPRQDQFGDTIKKVTAGPLAGVNAFASGLADQSQSPTLAATRDYVPAPLQRPVAALGDLGGLALTGIGAGIAGAAGLIGEIAGGSPTGERKLANDLIAMSQVAVPELAGVGGTVRTGGAAAKAAARVPSPRQVQAQAADNLGIVPSLGMTGKTGGMLAAGLEKVPFAGSVIAKDAARLVGDVERAFKASVGRVGNAVTADAAGTVLQSGLKGAVDKFKTRSAELYAKVAAKIPKDARFTVDQTRATVADTKSAFEGNPVLAQKLGLNEWDAAMAEAERGGLSWDAMSQFRSDIGRALSGDKGALSDQQTGRLKRMYAALTDDMEAAARQVGGGAYGSWKSAANHYKHGAERIERSLDATISVKNPERAFEAFRALTQEGRTTADIHRVREIKAALPPEDWRDVSASIVDRLGRANAGAQGAEGNTFSPATFLTEWNKLTPEGKRVLLPEDVRTELEDLAKVAEAAKAGNRERNLSNTGTATNLMALAAGSVLDLGTAAGTLGGLTITAKAMTSTPFLRAMNRFARGDAAQIKAMANGDGPFATDAKTVLQLMGAQTIAQPANSPERARMAN